MAFDIVSYLLAKKDLNAAMEEVPHLNEAGKVPAENLPSYVDDVVEGYLYNDAFYEDEEHTVEIEGEDGKIYIDLPSGFSYRYSGSLFVQIGGVDLELNAVLPIGANVTELKSIRYGENYYNIKSQHVFESSWRTSGTVEQFCSDIVNDTTAKPGMLYLGKLTCSDLPAGLIQGEAIVDVISEDANGKALHITITSVDTAPYRWEYGRAKVNGNYVNTGWVAYQLLIDSNHKVSSDLIDDTNKTHKFVTAQDKIDWTSKYDKPNTGIPATDLADAVQTSLGKADSAVQDANYVHTDNNFDATYKGNVDSNTAARHIHSNKALLDTYTQTEANIKDAVDKKHSHTNKALLDTYTQTEVDLADAVSKKHNHTNKALLDTYTQTEANIADAVDKKHSHTNKSVLDGITSSDITNWNDKADEIEVFKQADVAALPVSNIDEKTIYKVSSGEPSYYFLMLIQYTDSTKTEINMTYGGNFLFNIEDYDKDSNYIKPAVGWPWGSYDHPYIIKKSDISYDDDSDVTIYMEMDDELYNFSETENAYMRLYTHAPEHFYDNYDSQTDIDNCNAWVASQGPAIAVARYIYLDNAWINFDELIDKTTLAQEIADNSIVVELNVAPSTTHVTGTLTSAQIAKLNKNTRIILAYPRLDMIRNILVAMAELHDLNSGQLSGYIFSAPGVQCLQFIIGLNGEWDLSIAQEFENVANKVTTISSSSTDSEYPSARAVYQAIDNKYSKPSGGIPKTDLASDVQTSLGKADTSVQQVVGKGLSTNDFTNTDKGNISKALYFKGAFDSDDGKTRQTGYAKSFEELVGQLRASYYGDGIPSWANSRLSINTTFFANGDIVANVPVMTNSQAWNYAGSENIVIGYEATKLSIYGKSPLTNSDLVKVSIQIQYKLTTSYKDTPIENQSILPLDSNMANKIRQKVVDSLNLCNVGWRVGAYDGTSGQYDSQYTNYYASLDYIKVSPNTTYTIKASNSETKLYIFCYSINKEYLLLLSPAVNERTFTTNAQTEYIAFNTNQNNPYSDVMLVEADHPYPHRDFNQKEHTTNNEATLLKNEYEKCSNLLNPYNIGYDTNSSPYFKLDLSVGTYTFSANTSLRFEVYTIVNGTVVTKIKDQTGTSVTFTITDTANPIGVYISQTLGVFITDLSPYDVMLNIGGTPEPYHLHYGEILHKADLATLLWTNPSPNSEFASQPINVDMTNYKYIIIEYKRISDSDWQETAIKKLGVAVRPRDANIGFCLFEPNIEGDIYYRPVSFASLTQLDILTARYKPDNSSANGWLIPVKIYGTNIP